MAHQLRDIIAEGDQPDRLEAVLGDRRLKHSKVNRFLSSAILHNRPQSFIFLFSRTNFNLYTYDSTLTSYLCYAISKHTTEIYNFLLSTSFNVQIQGDEVLFLTKLWERRPFVWTIDQLKVIVSRFPDFGWMIPYDDVMNACDNGEAALIMIDLACHYAEVTGESQHTLLQELMSGLPTNQSLRDDDMAKVFRRFNDLGLHMDERMEKQFKGSHFLDQYPYPLTNMLFQEVKHPDVKEAEAK
jgi:hypothetical protein